MGLAHNNVFLNVPFDRQYRKLFRALIFTLYECGFHPRCTLEDEDGSQNRLEKLYAIIGECSLGIHDLSRTTLDSSNRLPRFNMPLELGIFLGAKKYGSAQHRGKSCLILDRDQYRYQKYCSDISGQDIRAHQNDVGNAIGAVRNWLRSVRPARLPGGEQIGRRYFQFHQDLPAMCSEIGIDRRDPPYLDYCTLLLAWRSVNPGK